VLAFQLGKRTVNSALHFMNKLSVATDPEQRFQLTTDGLNAYPYAVAEMLGDRVGKNLCLQRTGSVPPLQPARLRRGDPHARIRRPRKATNLHQPH
jgi:hypothetical protein